MNNGVMLRVTSHSILEQLAGAQCESRGCFHPRQLAYLVGFGIPRPPCQAGRANKSHLVLLKSCLPISAGRSCTELHLPVAATLFDVRYGTHDETSFSSQAMVKAAYTHTHTTCCCNSWIM